MATTGEAASCYRTILAGRWNAGDQLSCSAEPFELKGFRQFQGWQLLILRAASCVAYVVRGNEMSCRRVCTSDNRLLDSFNGPLSFAEPRFVCEHTKKLGQAMALEFLAKCEVFLGPNCFVDCLVFY